MRFPAVAFERRRAAGNLFAMDDDSLEFGTLSRRQRECLALVAAGYESKEIGELLGIAPGTVDNHLKQVTRQFGISSRREIARRFAAASPEIVQQTIQRLDSGRKTVAEQQFGRPVEDVGSRSEEASGKPQWPIPTSKMPTNEMGVGQRLLWIAAIAVGAAVIVALLITLNRSALLSVFGAHI